MAGGNKESHVHEINRETVSPEEALQAQLQRYQDAGLSYVIVFNNGKRSVMLINRTSGGGSIPDRPEDRHDIKPSQVRRSPVGR